MGVLLRSLLCMITSSWVEATTVDPPLECVRMLPTRYHSELGTVTAAALRFWFSLYLSRIFLQNFAFCPDVVYVGSRWRQDVACLVS